MRKSLVYSRVLQKKPFFPLGYIDWYTYMYKDCVEAIFVNRVSPEMLEAIKKKALASRYRFGRRMLKTHPVSIPVNTIFLFLNGFIKEVGEELIDMASFVGDDMILKHKEFTEVPYRRKRKVEPTKPKEKMVQLEFDFGGVE